MSYITLTLKIEEDSIREYLEEYAGYDGDEIREMDIKSESTEAVSGALSNFFSDYAVIDENTLLIGDWS